MTCTAATEFKSIPKARIILQNLVRPQPHLTLITLLYVSNPFLYNIKCGVSLPHMPHATWRPCLPLSFALYPVISAAPFGWGTPITLCCTRRSKCYLNHVQHNNNALIIIIKHHLKHHLKHPSQIPAMQQWPTLSYLVSYSPRQAVRASERCVRHPSNHR